MSKYILFDLDGTLTDPFDGITNSVIYALKKFGIEESDRDKLKSFIGPPLYKSFMEEYGFCRDDGFKAVNYYREYYSERGIFENVLYSGIEETLSNLSSEGKSLFVATSKPTVFAQKILRHFDIAKYFTLVAGATLDSTLVEKADIINYALEKSKADRAECVMVGDRMHDIYGAKANAIKSVGVLYGYGSFKELTGAGADAIAETPDKIVSAIQKL